MELKQLLTPWNWFKKEEEQSLLAQNKNSMNTVDHPLGQLHRELDKLFENFFQEFPLPSSRRENRGVWGGLLQPQVDIGEDTKQYTITMEVPGVSENDIDLTVADGTLMIRGEKRYEQENHDKQYHRIERSYGSFQRLLSLPSDADESTIDAKFRNGILTISVAKDQNSKPPMRKIMIT